MAEAAGLLEKYTIADGSDLVKAAETHKMILAFKPDWDSYEATKGCAHIMKLIEADAPAIKNKSLILGHISVLGACMTAMSMQDSKPVQWLLTFFYDLLREDSTSYSIFEEGAKIGVSIHKPLVALLGKQGVDGYSADKAAWLLTAVMSHLPRSFSKDDVKGLLAILLDSESPCTELGVLEALTNLLKTDVFRTEVWNQSGVLDRIFSIDPKSAPSPYLYKCVFAIWMLSYDPEVTKTLKAHKVIIKLREILTYSRVEKVIRLCLTVLRNFLTNKGLCEDIVEEGILEAVQQLEFEKWRDTELYEEIREVAGQISLEVSEMSNFDRYERELQTGHLAWGFIHSSPFWAQNALKFESNNFRALKLLAGLLLSPLTDATTLAVACHDLGEFVTSHPLGKKQVAQLQVKERVMELMSSTDGSYREVRREALLCCQKMMLNKWQDMDKP
ncbi:unnamed protein product [Polarella glacialis]|uniref:V-type proton ATPase subunit H n=1 Tax=Polarella glacialis TaxID=89957 RepID=A0A813HCQ3_POLGL|nr:unnamed protein product [Polarella glacialis]